MIFRNTFKLFSKSIILLLCISCTSTAMIDYRKMDKSQAKDIYMARNNAIHSFSASADITLNYYEAGKLESQKFNANILWNENDSMAIEMNYGLMGITLADVAKMFVGKNNYVFVTRDNLFLSGLSDDNYLNQLFRIDIPLKQWAKIIFICALDLDREEISERIRDDKIFFESDHEEIFFRSDIMQPSKYLYNSSTGNQIQITYQGIIEAASIKFPQRIVYYNEKDKSETIIEYKSIKLNKALPKKGFEVKIPSQMEQIIYD